MSNWLKNNASTILTSIGALGMIATIILAVKETPNAAAAKAAAETEKQAKLSTVEIIKAEAPAYVPAAVTGVGSLFCIFGANMLNRKQQASLISAYAALENVYHGYKKKVRDICGPDTDEFIEKEMEHERQDKEEDNPPWDAKQTFYIQGQKRFFELTMEQVIRAEYELNRSFVQRGVAPLNELYDLLGIELTEEGQVVGWSQVMGDVFFGYNWIEFGHRHYTTDEGLQVCEIELLTPPHTID